MPASPLLLASAICFFSRIKNTVFIWNDGSQIHSSAFPLCCRCVLDFLLHRDSLEYLNLSLFKHSCAICSSPAPKFLSLALAVRELCSVIRADPKLIDPPASASQVLGFQVCSTTAQLNCLIDWLIFVLFCYFETGSPYVVLAVLALTLKARLSYKSQRSICLCLSIARIKGLHHCPWP